MAREQSLPGDVSKIKFSSRGYGQGRKRNLFSTTVRKVLEEAWHILLSIHNQLSNLHLKTVFNFYVIGEKNNINRC